MVEGKDPVLWGPEFTERGHAYAAAMRGIGDGMRLISSGERDGLPRLGRDGKALILGQFGLAQRYPQLEGPWIEAALFAFSRLPPEDDGEWDTLNMAKGRAMDLKSTEALALEHLDGIGRDTRMVTSLMDEAMGILMSPREKGDAEKALEAEIAELEQKLAESKSVFKAPKRAEGAAGEEDLSWNDIDEELDLEIAGDAAETLEPAAAEKKAELEELVKKAEAEWKGRLDQEESLLEGYKEQLVEQIGEAAAYAGDRSAAVRRGAAEVLMDARDARSLTRFCYVEMDPGAREAAFRKAVGVARMGPDEAPLSMSMVLRREELGMLLRMVEDPEPGIAAQAWEFAEWLLENGKLDGEQVDYLEMHAKGAENEVAARVLSNRVKAWVAGACGGGSEERVSALTKVLEGIWSGLKLEEEERELVVEFTDDPDAGVSAQAFRVALELCRMDGLAPAQVAALARRAHKIEDGDRRIGTMAALFDLVPEGSLEVAGAQWLLAVAVAGTGEGNRAEMGAGVALKMIIDGKASPGQVEDFVSLVDSAKDGPIREKKERIFACVKQAVDHGGLTGKAAGILGINVDRYSQLFLDTVPDGRASGISMRGSRPPKEGRHGCASSELQKIKR